VSSYTTVSRLPSSAAAYGAVVYPLRFGNKCGIPYTRKRWSSAATCSHSQLWHPTRMDETRGLNFSDSRV